MATQGSNGVSYREGCPREMLPRGTYTARRCGRGCMTRLSSWVSPGSCMHARTHARRGHSAWRLSVISKGDPLWFLVRFVYEDTQWISLVDCGWSPNTPVYHYMYRVYPPTRRKRSLSRISAPCRHYSVGTTLHLYPPLCRTIYLRPLHLLLLYEHLQ